MPEILLTTNMEPESSFDKTVKIKPAMSSVHINLGMAKPEVTFNNIIQKAEKGRFIFRIFVI